jgi:uncharacterized membrane protein
MSLVDLLRTIAQTIATLVEGIGVAIVAVAVIVAAVRYVVVLLRRIRPFPPEGLRLSLGRSLALSLEFLLGADILRTAVEPSWDEIGRLAAIAAIRTALNYFLQREIAQDARMTQETQFLEIERLSGTSLADRFVKATGGDRVWHRRRQDV